MAPAPSSTNSITGQNSLDEDSDCGPPSRRSLVLHADLEDGEITEENHSAGRSTASTTPTPRTAVPVELVHKPKPPPTVGNTNVAPLEPGPGPEPTRTPTPDLGSPRPLSDEELDAAKSVVLDLLGWGVEPEYLIECGVSSQAIYRIFTELHLRLPANLSYLG